MTLKARLTAAIDSANAMLAINLTMPCRIEAVSLLADGMLAEVAVRFDNGTAFLWITSAATLSPLTLLNAAHCAHTIDFLGIMPDPDEPADVTAFASGYSPPVERAEDGSTATHAGPGAIQ